MEVVGWPVVSGQEITPWVPSCAHRSTLCRPYPLVHAHTHRPACLQEGGDEGPEEGGDEGGPEGRGRETFLLPVVCDYLEKKSRGEEGKEKSSSQADW